MTAVADRYEGLAGKGRSTDRLEFFSDAVFAIAMTLLVIDLAVPEEGTETSWQVLVSLVPGFLSYALSFWIIATNWSGHHRKFRLIHKYDRRLVALNLLLLFLIALVPFPTSLLAHYAPELAAVVLYASVVGLISIMQYVLWAYAYRARLLDTGVDLGIYRYIRRGLLVVPAVFAASILIAVLWDPLVAMYSWIAIWPASLIVQRYDPKVVAKPVKAA